MAYITTQTQSWQPPSITIGDGANNGASLFPNVGAGLQISFDATSDDEYLITIPLRNNGIDYDGSDLQLELDWQLFSTAPGVGDNVIWEIDYAFTKSDATEDAYTLVDGNLVDTIVVDTRLADRKYVDTLSIMTGKVGARKLQLTIRRNAQGAGSDSYAGAADVYGMKLIKV